MNKIILIGEMSDKIMTTTRTSGLTDAIPVSNTQSGRFYIEGELRSYNTPDRHLRLYVQPQVINPADPDIQSENIIEISGYICKTPVYRTTPNGREICEILLASPREGTQSDYIPCIAWGKTARTTSEYKIGDKVHIIGRLQSRDYLKGDTPKTTYEISVTTIKING